MTPERIAARSQLFLAAHRCCAHMPASMAATNSQTCGARVARFISAGPGQKPASPQPVPNRAEPVSSLRSMTVLVGSCMGSPNKAVLRRLAQVKAIKPTAMAPPMTKPSEGSHRPKKSRKFCTLAGLPIPERIRPRPNTNPQSKAAILMIMMFSLQTQAMTWRITNTVIAPVAMKVSVAALTLRCIICIFILARQIIISPIPRSTEHCIRFPK